MRTVIPLLLSLSFPFLAQARDADAAAGKAVAVAICSACHSIGPRDPGPEGAERRGPDFVVLAARTDLTAEKIRVFLKTTNLLRDAPLGMPNPKLSEDQIADVIAYVFSLRGADSQR